MKSKTCMRCHDMKHRKTTNSKADGLTVSSEAMLKHDAVGIQCTVCHNRVVHPAKIERSKFYKSGVDNVYIDGMKMKEGCMRCHSTALDKPVVIKGKKPPTTCTTCHDPKWIGMPIGHGKSQWRKDHGSVVLAKGINYCLTCHAANKVFNYNTKLWCTKCHDSSGTKLIAFPQDKKTMGPIEQKVHAVTPALPAALGGTSSH